VCPLTVIDRITIERACVDMSHSRYFVNDLETFERADPHKELLTSLKNIVIRCPPPEGPQGGWDFAGLYSGPTSTAYLFYQLSLTHQGVKLNGKTMYEWCLAYFGGPGSRQPYAVGKLDPSHCGIAQELLAHTAVTAVASNVMKCYQACQDVFPAKSCLLRLCSQACLDRICK